MNAVWPDGSGRDNIIKSPKLIEITVRSNWGSYGEIKSLVGMASERQSCADASSWATLEKMMDIVSSRTKDIG